jgi:hypothetical protein
VYALHPPSSLRSGTVYAPHPLLLRSGNGVCSAPPSFEVRYQPPSSAGCSICSRLRHPPSSDGVGLGVGHGYMGWDQVVSRIRWCPGSGGVSRRGPSRGRTKAEAKPRRGEAKPRRGEARRGEARRGEAYARGRKRPRPKVKYTSGCALELLYPLRAQSRPVNLRGGSRPPTEMRAERLRPRWGLAAPPPHASGWTIGQVRTCQVGWGGKVLGRGSSSPGPRPLVGLPQTPSYIWAPDPGPSSDPLV